MNICIPILLCVMIGPEVGQVDIIGWGSIDFNWSMINFSDSDWSMTNDNA